MNKNLMQAMNWHMGKNKTGEDIIVSIRPIKLMDIAVAVADDVREILRNGGVDVTKNDSIAANPVVEIVLDGHNYSIEINGVSKEKFEQIADVKVEVEQAMGRGQA